MVGAPHCLLYARRGDGFLGRGEARWPVGGQRFSGPRRRGCGSDELLQWCALAVAVRPCGKGEFGGDAGPIWAQRAAAVASAPHLAGSWGGSWAVNAVAKEVKMAGFGRPCRRVEGGAGRCGRFRSAV
jgi:hypothetical protein